MGRSDIFGFPIKPGPIRRPRPPNSSGRVWSEDGEGEIYKDFWPAMCQGLLCSLCIFLALVLFNHVYAAYINPDLTGSTGCLDPQVSGYFDIHGNLKPD